MSDSLLDTLGDLLRPPVPYPDPFPAVLRKLLRCECGYVFCECQPPEDEPLPPRTSQEFAERQRPDGGW